MVRQCKKQLVKSLRYYIRDSGILHRLLGIEHYDALLSNPVLGKSWEGFAVENIHATVYETSGEIRHPVGLIHHPESPQWNLPGCTVFDVIGYHICIGLVVELPGRFLRPSDLENVFVVHDKSTSIMVMHLYASILILASPSSSGVSGRINSGLLEHDIVITGHQGFAVPAVFARHAAAGPQHVNIVLDGTFGADAANESFSVREGPGLIVLAPQCFDLPIVSSSGSQADSV